MASEGASCAVAPGFTIVGTGSHNSESFGSPVRPWEHATEILDADKASKKNFFISCLLVF